MNTEATEHTEASEWAGLRPADSAARSAAHSDAQEVPCRNVPCSSVCSVCSVLKIAVFALRDYDRDGDVAHAHR